MKLLVLNHEYPPIGGGGGQACKDIIEELASRGYEITLVTAHFKDLPRESREGTVRILRVPSLRKQAFRVGFMGMGVYILNSIFTGLKVIRRWKPDLIHVHFAVPAGVSAYVLHLLTGIPYILTAHLGDVPGGVPEKTGRWFKWVFPFTIPVWKHAARIAAVSEFTASLARKHYHVEPEIIPNGMKIEPQESPVSVNHPPRIAFAGRFMPQKNLFTFIDILDSVRDLNWNCSMLGDGPLYQPVKARITELGLTDRFSLPGWVNTDEVISCFKQSDILLMPSLSEGLSVVGVQALAAGLAIVANNVGGFTDLVEAGQNGVLAEAGDAQALKDAIRMYLSTPDLLLKARHASLVAARKFDIRNIADRYETIFNKLNK